MPSSSFTRLLKVINTSTNLQILCFETSSMSRSYTSQLRVFDIKWISYPYPLKVRNDYTIRIAKKLGMVREMTGSVN